MTCKRRAAAVLAAAIATGCRGDARLDATAPAAPWLLIAPPYRYRSGAVRMDERESLSEWRRLEGFTSIVDCRRFRDAAIAGAPDDDTLATLSMSRCESAERAAGARLTPDEEHDGR